MPEYTTYPHIALYARGVPCLDGTRHRVIDLVADHVAHGYRAAHIVEPCPDLTTAPHAASPTGGGTRAAGGVMRRRSMGVHAKACHDG
jgi:hypothetical protein